MTTTIQITGDDIAREMYSTKQKLNGHRFPLEDRIDQYLPKKDGSQIYNHLATFVTLQQLIYQKLTQVSQDKIATSISHHLSALATLDDQAENLTSCDYFTTRKIDHFQEHPIPINDSLQLYLSAIDEARPRPTLELLTQSFFEWVVQSTAREWSTRKVEEKVAEYSLSFDGKTYTPNLGYKREEKRIQFDLGKYDQTGQAVQINSKKVAPMQGRGDIKTAQSAAPDTYIYGHDDFKAEFKKIATIVRNRDYLSSIFPQKKLFQNYLLLGPPGTGKTTLVSTLARQCGLKFYNIPCVTIGSEFFSRSATNLHDVFGQAAREIDEKKEQGVILFFDEFDHIAKHRGYGNSSENDSLITTLNENLDGSSSRAGVITFAASNVENMLDPAVVSRFRKFYIGYPQNDDEIVGIHNTIIKKMEKYAKQSLFDSIDYTQILPFAHRDERYKSGRVIDRIITNAALHKVLRDLSLISPLVSTGVASLKSVTTADLVAEYEKFNMENDQQKPDPQKSLLPTGTISRTR